MAYVPKNARWFLAQLVEEIRVEGAKLNIVHINYVIVEAASPEDAYARALEMGHQGSREYLNPGGKKVCISFRGLRDLDVIHDQLEHGCEIMFEEKLGIDDKRIQKLLRAKEELEVFSPVQGRGGRPDYSSKEIMDEVKRRMHASRDRATPRL